MKLLPLLLTLALLACAPALRDADDPLVAPDPLSAYLGDGLMAFVLPASEGERALNFLIAKATAARISRPVTTDEMFTDPRQLRMSGATRVAVLDNARYLMADWIITDNHSEIVGNFQVLHKLTAEGSQTTQELTHVTRADMQALADASAHQFLLQPIVRVALASVGTQGIVDDGRVFQIIESN